ncbi:MAG: sulfotransferase [Nevskia sp.]|nr:sulfotransferase [Nevskia sp.]
MKLSHPFFRLPLLLDIERLQAEVAQFAEDQWQRHPDGFEGNTAIRLISVGGEENDRVAGAMRPTPQLQRCPYIRQVLANFGVVFSRSRLMRLAPGAEVPEHCDSNYHWFHRVRIHIPVFTEPQVSFSCDGKTVHMAAGEAWIFDNWRLHRVHNGGSRNRVHLVADTTGNAAFWNMVGASQYQDFARRPELPLLRYRPGVDAQPHCERYNVSVVMPPSEVEQLTYDLLADLRSAPDAPERPAYEHFVVLATRFCREWRTLWSLYADTPEGWVDFGRLRDYVAGEVERLPRELVCASNRMAVVDVFALRVLRFALHGPADTRPAAHRPAPATVGPLRRPLLIVAAPRSGSTLLFETLAQAPGLYTPGGETHGVVEGLPQLRPLAPGVDSNRLTQAHVDATVRQHIHAALAGLLRDRDGGPAGVDGARFLEKTPKNALRIPFFDALFPDAQFLFLWRDPHENISSIMEAWRSGGWIMYPQLPGWDGPWSMLLPPGWQSLRGAPLEEVAAFQWARTNEVVLDDLARLPSERWMALNYADFLGDPAAAVRRVCDFAGLEFDERLAAYLQRPLPLSAYTLTPPAADKWRTNEAAITPLLPRLQEVAARLDALRQNRAGAA